MRDMSTLRMASLDSHSGQGNGQTLIYKELQNLCPVSPRAGNIDSRLSHQASCARGSGPAHARMGFGVDFCGLDIFSGQHREILQDRLNPIRC